MIATILHSQNNPVVEPCMDGLSSSTLSELAGTVKPDSSSAETLRCVTNSSYQRKTEGYPWSKSCKVEITVSFVYMV